MPEKTAGLGESIVLQCSWDAAKRVVRMRVGGELRAELTVEQAERLAYELRACVSAIECPEFVEASDV